MYMHPCVLYNAHGPTWGGIGKVISESSGFQRDTSANIRYLAIAIRVDRAFRMRDIHGLAILYARYITAQFPRDFPVTLR